MKTLWQHLSSSLIRYYGLLYLNISYYHVSKVVAKHKNILNIIVLVFYHYVKIKKEKMHVILENKTQILIWICVLLFYINSIISQYFFLQLNACLNLDMLDKSMYCCVC